MTLSETIQYQSGFSLTKDNSSFSSYLGLNLLLCAATLKEAFFVSQL